MGLEWPIRAYGALLLSANINPAISAFSADNSHGRNQYTDYGLDAGYQFLGDPNIATAYVIYIHENQNLKGSFNSGASSQPSNGLNQLNVNATYYYMNTYGATLGWQYTWGTANPLLFRRHPSPAAGTASQTATPLSLMPTGPSARRMGAAIRQSEDRSPVCHLYDVQRRQRNYDGFGRICQRQQHGVPLRLDGILSIGWSISIASVLPEALQASCLMLSVGGVAAKFLAAIVVDRSAATNCTAGRHQNRRIALPLSKSACMLNPFQPGNVDVVFSSRFGGHLATGRRGLRIAKLVDLPADITPHVPRHSFASVAAYLGYNEPKLASFLGHKTH